MKHRILLENNPALLRGDYFPEEGETPWAELDELRRTHVRLLAERASAGQALFDLQVRFEREDAGRREALATGLREGTSPELPPRTPEEERASALREALELAEASWEALGDFLAEAVETVVARMGAWESDLAEIDVEAEREREELRRRLAEIDVEARRYDRLRSWLSRAGQGADGFGVAWGHTSEPPASEPIGEALARVYGEVSHV